MGVKYPFEIEQLKPFHRVGREMPKPAPEKSDQVVEFDPALLPEEQAYVNHYLGYAEVLLHKPEAVKPCKNKIIELPRVRDSGAKKADDKAA